MCFTKPFTARPETGTRSGVSLRCATATEKKFTGRIDTMNIQGVLFLTAGYGRRMEPLSLIRPKALLPWGSKTVLGNLAKQLSVLSPRDIAFNAYRCPDLVRGELESIFPDTNCIPIIEEKPQGVSVTLSTMADILSDGTWIVVNTDMVIRDLNPAGIVRYHEETKADWTVMTGGFPEKGDYGPLEIDADGRFGTTEVAGYRHYWGISVMEPVISRTARRERITGSLFGSLAPVCHSSGLALRTFEEDGRNRWLDFGDYNLLPHNILEGGSFIHPLAELSSGVTLEGRYNIGSGARIASGTLVKDSVMLAGSAFGPGNLENAILPWNARYNGEVHEED